MQIIIEGWVGLWVWYDYKLLVCDGRKDHSVAWLADTSSADCWLDAMASGRRSSSEDNGESTERRGKERERKEQRMNCIYQV